MFEPAYFPYVLLMFRSEVRSILFMPTGIDDSLAKIHKQCRVSFCFRLALSAIALASSAIARATSSPESLTK